MKRREQGKTPNRAPVSIAARQLGEKMAAYRVKARMKQEDAANLLEMHSVTLSRMENGKAAPKAATLREMARIYGLPPADTDALLAMAEGAGGAGWIVPYRDVIPEPVSALADVEARATAVFQYETKFMPSSLQTPEYAEHVINLAGEVPLARRRQHLAFRLERQQRLLMRSPRPELRFIVHEAIFRAHVGAPRLMEDQLSHLVKLSRQRGIEVRVWTFDLGLHQWMSGAFTLLKSDGGYPHVVYSENQVEGSFDEKPQNVEQFARVFGQIRRKAKPIKEFQL